MLETVRLTRNFGPRAALTGVSLGVRPGQTVGLIGPSGAGKSTMLRLIAGSLAPSSGAAIVCGHDVARRPLAAKRALGYLPQRAPAYPEMTVAAFLRFVASLRGCGGAAAGRRVGEIAHLARITDALERPIAALPEACRRRVALAQTLLHDPPVLLLDCPSDGLDPNEKQWFRSLLPTLADDKAIVIATHLLEEAERVCSRIVILAEGRVVADAATAELLARSRFHNAVRLVLPQDAASAAVAAALSAIADVRAVEPANDVEGAGFWVFSRHGRPIVVEVAEAARRSGWPVAALHAGRGRLDDVFHAVTQPDAPAASPSFRTR